VKKKTKPCGKCRLSTLCIGSSVKLVSDEWLVMCKTCREVYILRENSLSNLGRPIVPKDLCLEMVEQLDTRNNGVTYWLCDACEQRRDFRWPHDRA